MRNDQRLNRHVDIPQTPPQQNPLLNWPSQTEFVKLPSRGAFYPTNHPWFGKEEIEIRQMTAKEEDILTNKTYLKKNVAISKLLESVLIDPVDPSSLLIGDRNAILVACRIAAYGPEYEVQMRCDGCGRQSKTSCDLSSLPHKTLENEELDDLEVEHSQGLFSLVLPQTKFKVTFRLMSAADEISITQENEKRKNNNMPEMGNAELLLRVIDNVNGISDGFQLLEFTKNMPARDSSTLRRAIKNCMPDVDMTIQFICPHCETDHLSEVPITTEFFWPRH